MMGSSEPPPGEIRHRLLEGVLLRLARLPDAEQFVLRGGMLLRMWFRPLARPANDLDLVATFPFDVDATARRLVPLLADRGVADGVTLDAERFRVEAIWQDTDFPGVRMFGAGEIDGVEDEFSIDVTFGEPLVPAPVVADYPTACGAATRLMTCRPETIAGRKMHALQHMGGLRWRPKDLNDLRLLLARLPMDADALAESIAASFASRGDSTAAARTLFRRPRWLLKSAAARWQHFVVGGGTAAPENLAAVVAEVAEKLDPILDRLP